MPFLEVPREEAGPAGPETAESKEGRTEQRGILTSSSGKGKAKENRVERKVRAEEGPARGDSKKWDWLEVRELVSLQQSDMIGCMGH